MSQKKETKPTIEFLYLLLTNGHSVEVSYPVDAHYELMESIEGAIRAAIIWYPESVDDGCSAAYCGHLLSGVNMRDVVGVI